MECSCRRCNGLDEMEIFFGGGTIVEPTEEKVGSVYDRLRYLHQKIAPDLAQELDEIIEEVDSIDDELFILQEEASGTLQTKIGELSKRLY